MSKKYDEYLFNHIQAVKACMSMLSSYPKEASSHDMSKYSDEEYDAYDNYFYPEKCHIDDGEKKIIKAKFNYAWLHHQNTNTHHWQYWLLINDEGGIEPLQIPYNYVFEMVADWGSFAYQKKNGDELLKWYESHKDKMILHELTRCQVEMLVPRLAHAIDEYFKEES